MKLLTIEEVRQSNLRQVIDGYFDSAADLAREMGIDKNNVSRWLAWPKKDSRVITSDSARAIEVAANRRGAKLPAGWMDHVHNHIDREADELYEEVMRENPQAVKAFFRAMLSAKDEGNQ